MMLERSCPKNSIFLSHNIFHTCTANYSDSQRLFILDTVSKNLEGSSIHLNLFPTLHQSKLILLCERSMNNKKL